MKRVLVCGTQGMAIATMLVEAMKDTEVKCVSKPIELTCHDTPDIYLTPHELTQRPIVKRGKGKVKRWG